MKSLEESIIAAMDGTNVEIIPFLPYILQDIWEIGAPPANVITLIEKHASDFSSLKVLDLGCGKGAISVRIAERFKCYCYGIDAIKEFIDEARKKAREHSVEKYCEFEVADIRERIKGQPEYDIIILGAIGPVFGSYYQTMTTLLPHLKSNGVIIVDDAYIEDSSTYTNPLILKRSELLSQLKQAGAALVDEVIANESEEIFEEYNRDFDNIQQRCKELMAKYPDKAQLFEDYINTQREEYGILESKVICPTMAIKRQKHCYS